MRSFDFAPYYRSTVGFDRLFSMLDQVGGVEGSAPSYPPYNIARTGENDYRISVAVAGFTDADLAIEAKENTLTLRARSRPTTGRRVATCSTRASPRGTPNVVSNRSAATSFVCTGPPQ
jgi:molecular chaperone IbpA